MLCPSTRHHLKPESEYVYRCVYVPHVMGAAFRTGPFILTENDLFIAVTDVTAVTACLCGVLCRTRMNGIPSATAFCDTAVWNLYHTASDIAIASLWLLRRPFMLRRSTAMKSWFLTASPLIHPIKSSLCLVALR